MMKKLSLGLMAACLLGGCADRGVEKVAANGQTTPQPTQETGGAATAPETAGAAKTAEVPPSLKHAAYEYYGLGNTKPQNMEIRLGEQVLTGTDSYELVSVEDGKAVYRSVRTGALAEHLGNETVTVTPGGVQTMGTTQGKLEGTHIVPASLQPGTTWKVDIKITQQSGAVVEENSTWKAVRVEKVKTKAGEFDALLATTSGTVNVGGQTQRIEGRTWYAKGRGVVKAELKMSGNNPATVVIEAT